MSFSGFAILSARSSLGSVRLTRNCVLAIAAVCPALLLAAAPFRIGREAMPKIVVGDAMRPFVMRAAQDVAGDIEKIFGARPEIARGETRRRRLVVDDIEASSGQGGGVVSDEHRGQFAEHRCVKLAQVASAVGDCAERMPEVDELGKEFPGWMLFDHLDVAAVSGRYLQHTSELVGGGGLALRLEVEDRLHRRTLYHIVIMGCNMV